MATNAVRSHLIGDVSSDSPEATELVFTHRQGSGWVCSDPFTRQRAHMSIPPFTGNTTPVM